MTVRKIEPICAKGHDAYVIRQWSLTYNKFCAIRFGAFVLDFSPDFSCTVEIVPFARALLWYIVQVRYCDLDNINSAMQTIWAQQSTSSMLLLHGTSCKLRVKRGVGQIYIVQSKQALPINYNHGTLEEGKKEESIKEKHLVNELMLTAIVCDRFREIKSKGNLQHHAEQHGWCTLLWC